jgi:hypothetical protein
MCDRERSERGERSEGQQPEHDDETKFSGAHGVLLRF